MEGYQYSNWSEDKLLIAKLLDRKMYNKAREHLNLMHQVVQGDAWANQILGMLFVVEILVEKEQS